MPPTVSAVHSATTAFSRGSNGRPARRLGSGKGGPKPKASSNARFCCQRKRIGQGRPLAVTGRLPVCSLYVPKHPDQSKGVVDRGVRRRSRCGARQRHRVGAPGGAGPYVTGPARPKAATPGNRGPAVARGGPRIWVRQPAPLRWWRLPALHRLFREGRKKGKGGPARAREFKARVRGALAG